MKTTNWDRIVTSAPLNRDAAVARDGKGVCYEADVKRPEGTFRAYAPPLLRRLSPQEVEIEMVGKRFGSLVVLGKMEGRRRGWVVRCDCGWYEIRKGKTLRNPDGHGCARMCTECEHVDQLRRGLKPSGPMKGVIWKSVMAR